MHQVLRLINRNLTVSLNPGFLIWQIIFPLIYIFVAGFAYTALIPDVTLQGQSLEYPAYLATGMIGFNIMNSTLISGLIIWNDRRHGMFEQILSGPYTIMHYILANVCTISIIGAVSAGLIAAVGIPVFFEAVVFSPLTIPIMVFAIITGSILFGSLATIISARLKSSEGFNVVINTTFIFFAFVSTVFYPAQGAPAVLATVFYFNPLTYVVDTIRAGIFGNITEIIMVEMLALSLLAVGLFVLAARMMTRLNH